MLKIVNSDKGYILILEKKEDSEEIDCVAYETYVNMSGTEVADELGITRQAVCQSLKKSIKKIYYRIKNIYQSSSPIEILAIMATMFNIYSESEYKKFFNLFPPNIKGEVHAEVFKTKCHD